MVLAKLLCDELILEGYWADYIDPCSGLPVSEERIPLDKNFLLDGIFISPPQPYHYRS